MLRRPISLIILDAIKYFISFLVLAHQMGTSKAYFSHVVRIIFFTTAFSTAALANSYALRIQTLISELGGNIGVIDGKIGNLTRAGASEVLGFDVSEMELADLLDALEAAHSEKFDIIASSSSRCEVYLDRRATYEYLPDGSTRTNVIFPGEEENCRTFARLTTQSEFRGPIWDKPFFIEVDTTGARPRLIVWAAEEVAPAGEVTNIPARAYLINLELDIESIFTETSTTLLENIERPFPFSIRRAELTDLEGDGDLELVLLGNREDGRGPGTRKNMMVSVNQTDVSYIYQFENNTIVPFASPSFSHDLMIADLNLDGYQEIIDFAFNKRGMYQFGFQVCDGQNLECRWQFQEEIIAGRSTIAFDHSLNKHVLFGNCGVRHTNGVETNNQLCWFGITYDPTAASPIRFELIDKAENQRSYDTRQSLMNWMRFVGQQNGWQIADVDPSTSFIMGGMGFHSALYDIDGDGDLDTINYNANRICVKNSFDREYYEETECSEMQAISTIFIQNNGNFEKHEEHSVRFNSFISAQRYAFFDFEQDALVDIHSMTARSGHCIDHMATSLTNLGGGTFELFERNDIMGQYGCEIQASFFTYNGEPFRVFLAKATYEKHNFQNPEVFISIEYLGNNSQRFQSDKTVCDEALVFVFGASGMTVKWSEDPQAARWVSEAETRGLSCGVQQP
jgi:hypothetical protein